MSKFGDAVKANSRAQILTPAKSLIPWSWTVVVPSQNPQMHSLLDITSFFGEGIRLELRDPFGTSVWVGYLECDGAGQ